MSPNRQNRNCWHRGIELAGDFVTRGNAVLSLITRKLAFLGRHPSDQAPASVFSTVHGSPSKTESVYAFESAIDALSLATYFLKTKTRDLLGMVGFVSTAGVSAKPIAVDADVKLYCAYDADPAGDAAAKTWPRRALPR